MQEMVFDVMAVGISDSPDNSIVSVSLGLRQDGSQYKIRLWTTEANAKKLCLLLKKLLKKREVIEGHVIALEEAFYQKGEIAPEDF